MFEHWIEAELTEFPQIVHLSGDGFSQDDGGNLIGVRVTTGREPPVPATCWTSSCRRC